MVWSACLVLTLICATNALLTFPGPFLAAELLVSLVLITWLMWGPRAGAVLVPVIGALLAAGWSIEGRLVPGLVQNDLLMRGTVCELPRTAAGVHRFVFEHDREQSTPGLPRRVYISWYRARVFPQAGERWQLKVRLKRPRGLSNPGAFDFERWAHIRGIGATGYVRNSPLNYRIAAHGSECRLAGLRQRIAGRIDDALNGRPGAHYLKALSVGARESLTQPDWALLRRTGTVHLMAISGLHIGLVAGLMFLLGRYLGRLLLWCGIELAPLIVGRWFGLTGALVYAALAGFSVPTLRALVMVGTVTVLTVLRRSIPAWQILATAMFVVLCVEPTAPLSAGFWLSFYAVGLLMLGAIGLAQASLSVPSLRMRVTRLAGQLVKAQVLLTIGLAPLSILFFAQVSLIAPIANLVVVPVFAALIVPLTLIGTGGLLISDAVGRFFLVPAAWTMERVLEFLQWLDRLPFTTWVPPPIAPAGIAMIVAVTLVAIWPRPLPGRGLVLTLLFALLGGASLSSGSPGLRIVVMDTGQGLAVLIQTRTHALVYDTGPAFRSSDAGRTVVLPVLRYFGIRQLDALVISHGDADHVGGAKSVLERFPEAELISAERFGLDFRRYRPCIAGTQWRWDGVLFRVLHPGDPGAVDWSENDGSCVLLIQTAHAAVLLPGDIERRAEAHLTRNARIPAIDLVIAPHHGSQSSSTPAFVAATRPRYIVFSVGYRNRWGFPDAQIVQRWRQAGACPMTTADNGALVFEINRAGWMTLQRRQRIDGRSFWTESADGLRPTCRLL